MGGQIFNFIAALLFMSGLVMISRISRQMKAEDRTGYRYISGGLSLLAAVSLLRIYNGLELFEGVPFLADHLFFQMIVWITVMSGMILLLSGISTWLPLSRAQRMYSKQRLHQVELVRKVAQLVKVESRAPVVLAKTLDYMITDFDFAHGALYVYSHKDRRMYLSSTSGHVTVAQSLLDLGDFEVPSSLHSRADEVAISRLAVRMLPAGLANPSVVQPVLCGHRLAALFLLWDDSNRAVDEDLMLNLKVAAGIIGMRIQLNKTGLLKKYNENLADCQKKLSELLYLCTPMTDSLDRIKELLKTVMPIDLLSVTFGTEDGRSQRYAVGENGTVLNEIGASSALPGGFDMTAGKMPEPIVINNLADESGVVIDDLVCSSGMGSMMAVPLAVENSFEGVCVIASYDKHCYNAGEVTALTALAPLLTGILYQERDRRNRAASLRRIKLVHEFNDLARQSKNRDDLFDRAAVILSDEVKPSIIRISTFDTDGAFMTSRTMLVRRPGANVTPTGGHMILSLMPLHRQLKESGKTIIVDQSRNQNPMSPIETAQAFLPDSEVALLVPITERGVVTGLIGMARKGDMQQKIFTPEDVEFTTALAGILSAEVAAETPALTETRRMTSGMLSETAPDPDRELKNRLKSSLTGIIGSVELIKSSGQQDEKIKRYLDIIDKSAQRMSSYCSEDAPV